MTETERVWARIKGTARKLAGLGRKLNIHEAERIVSSIIRDEHAEVPPREAVAYLAGELQGFVERYQDKDCADAIAAEKAQH